MATQSEAGERRTSESPLPSLTFATTSDTQIGPDLRIAANLNRVLLRQVKLQEVEDMQLELGRLRVVNPEAALAMPAGPGINGAFNSPLPAFPPRPLSYPRSVRTNEDPDPTELQDPPPQDQP